MISSKLLSCSKACYFQKLAFKEVTVSLDVGQSGQPLRLKKLVLGRIAEMDGGRSGSDVGESGSLRL